VEIKGRLHSIVWREIKIYPIYIMPKKTKEDIDTLEDLQPDEETESESEQEQVEEEQGQCDSGLGQETIQAPKPFKKATKPDDKRLKVNRTRTPAQIAAWEKCVAARTRNRGVRKEVKEKKVAQKERIKAKSSEIASEEVEKKLVKKAVRVKKKQILKKQILESSESESSDSEPDIQQVKKYVRKKQQQKRAQRAAPQAAPEAPETLEPPRQQFIFM